MTARRLAVLPRRALATRSQRGRANETHSLSALADALSDELEPLLTRPLPIPEQTARLTRGGGRCPIHGTLLAFDPWSPHEHRCPRCTGAYRGQTHDDWWAMGAQLWTVERAVHAAALYALRGREEHAELAARILHTIAERYDTWPNRDNVLGPSRPFFSTYLESIWLLNACHALALLEQAVAPGADSLGAVLRDTLIAPSARLIEGFPEGLSNRQVWNEVALLSARHMLGDTRGVHKRLAMHGGLPWIMEHGLLSDGSWYEGENYHLFAHRGLWYGVRLMAMLDHPLAASLAAKYHEGFVTPFLGLLPDDTLPSRRDSQYATSVRQWRFAEWLELGYAQRPDTRIAAMLARLYDGSGARRETGRWCSTADAERNMPATTLTRADLSWRALLMANAQAPTAEQWSPTSGVLVSQGLSVLRRDRGSTYLALEGGHMGGGHGHPDALALTMQSGDARWLQDPGTGSYTERTLHWYRSTLAHAAPLVDRASFYPESIELLAYQESVHAGWIWKRAHHPANGITIDRTIVALPHYLVDVLEWRADGTREITLSVAGDATIDGDGTWVPHEQRSAGGLEDGFDFASGTAAIPLPPLLTFHAAATRADPTDAHSLPVARAWYASGCDGVLVRAIVPGAPGHPPSQRHWLQVRGAAGRIVGVWSWPSSEGAVQSVQLDSQAMPFARILDTRGTTATHSRVADRWDVEMRSASTVQRFTLEPRAPIAVQASPIPGQDAMAADVHPLHVPLVGDDVGDGAPGTVIQGALRFALGESHYIATELPWSDANAPTATIQLAATDDYFVADVDAHTGPLVTNPAGMDNPLDNERADVNSDGLQWYAGLNGQGEWAAAGLVVPAPGAARASALIAASACEPDVSWRLTPTGWAMRLRWPRAQVPLDQQGSFRFDMVVNERPPERERRRGQLVLSGGGGFGYLRGDRHATTHALRLSFS